MKTHRYRVCRDERTISTHTDLEEAKKALRALKLGAHSEGYLDEIDAKGAHVCTLHHKQKTSGPLLDCD